MQSMESAVAERNSALQAATDELAGMMTGGAGGGSGTLKPSVGMEARARHLEAERARLESEKAQLERSVRDMKSSLEHSEGARRGLEAQLSGLGAEESELAKERALRQAAERRLAEAEASMRRLDQALKRSGTKLDVDVFQDVRSATLVCIVLAVQKLTQPSPTQPAGARFDGVLRGADGGGATRRRAH